MGDFAKTAATLAGVTAAAALLAIFLLWLDQPPEDPFTPDPPSHVAGPDALRAGRRLLTFRQQTDADGQRVPGDLKTQRVSRINLKCK